MKRRTMQEILHRLERDYGRPVWKRCGSGVSVLVETILSQNTSAANSRIVDVDVAAETANMTRAQILTQAGVSVLSQANQAPQLALKLLG